MAEQNQPKWYFKTWPLVVSFICLGPFMLPLVWANPRFSKNLKIIISLMAVALTIMMTYFFAGALKTVAEYFQAECFIK